MAIELTKEQTEGAVPSIQKFFRSKIEDLPATCFEDGLTYWIKKRK